MNLLESAWNWIGNVGKELSALNTIIGMTGAAIAAVFATLRYARKLRDDDKAKLAVAQNSIQHWTSLHGKEKHRADKLADELKKTQAMLPSLVLKKYENEISMGNEQLANRELASWIDSTRVDASEIYHKMSEWILAFYPDSNNPQSVAQASESYATLALTLLPGRKDTKILMVEILSISAKADEKKRDYAAADDRWQRVHSYIDVQSQTSKKIIVEAANAAGRKGDYSVCRILWHRIWTINRQTLGHYHSDTLTSQNNLGWACWQLGRFFEAEKLYLELYEERKRKYGEDDRKTVRAMFNLAAQYQAQGRDKEAEPLLFKALEVRRTLGNQEEINAALTNLGTLYQSQGRYTLAEKLLQEAVHSSRHAVGTDRVRLAQSLNNLAVLYTEMGEYDTSDLLLQQSIEIYEETLGREHPLAIAAQANLAAIFLNRGQGSGSETSLRAALELSERKLGVDHIQSAKIMANLGVALSEQKRYKEAEKFLLTAFEIENLELGLGNITTINTNLNIATIYTRQGRYEEAEERIQSSLEALMISKGAEHPWTANALANMGYIHASQDRYEEALECYTNALAIFKNTFGPDHPNTLAAETNVSIAKNLKKPPIQNFSIFFSSTDLE